MCRWLAYSGSPITLSQALYSQANSMIDQSLHSKLGAEATNGDGFGIGWYDDAPLPGVFHSVEPAWNDQNLREVTAHVKSGHFFAHLRAAIGSAVQQSNCHPFRHGNWLFMHNGYLDALSTVKRDLILAIDPNLYPELGGTTDTEILFYLALTFGLEEDPPDAVARAIGLVEAVATRTASNTRSRERSPRLTASARGSSAIPAKARRARCSSPRASRRSGRCIPTGRSSRRSPRSRGSSSRSQSATCRARGTRSLNRATAWSAAETTSCFRSRSSRRSRPPPPPPSPRCRRP